jgi:hypothetical protein
MPMTKLMAVAATVTVLAVCLPPFLVRAQDQDRASSTSGTAPGRNGDHQPQSDEITKEILTQQLREKLEDAWRKQKTPFKQPEFETESFSDADTATRRFTFALTIGPNNRSLVVENRINLRAIEEEVPDRIEHPNPLPIEVRGPSQVETVITFTSNIYTETRYSEFRNRFYLPDAFVFLNVMQLRKPSPDRARGAEQDTDGDRQLKPNGGVPTEIMAVMHAGSHKAMALLEHGPEGWKPASEAAIKKWKEFNPGQGHPWYEEQ